MADTGVFGMARAAAGVFESLDHAARLLDLDGIVSVAVKVPAGEVFEFGSGLDVAAAANGGDGGPALGVGGGHAPRAEAPHREAGQILAFVVNFVGFASLVEDGDGALAILGFRLPGPLLR